MTKRVRELDVAALRAAEFPWMDEGHSVYLNAASTGPTPQRTVRALQEFAARRAQPHTITVEEQFAPLVRSRALAAELIGARQDEIAVAIDTSYGINLAARALPMEPGDIVVTSDREFPANVYPWMALERERGVRLRLVPCRDGLPDEDALIAALDEPGVRVLTISWVSFATGARVNLERLGQACRERGIYFVVDAIQGIGAATLDVRRAQVDILACGAQKWLLSPWGTGFVYVRRELVEQLRPPMVSWLAVTRSADFNRLLDYDLTYHSDARRFELLTIGFQDFVGMVESLSLLEELGAGAIEQHVRNCADRLVEWAQRAPGIQLVTPDDPELRAGIVVIRPRDPIAAYDRLASAGVACSLREGTVRLAPHCYTTDADLERAMEAVEAAG
ncbi:MAG TPA: aminotransferase class V-fold PLP-dependent enzyme [Gemmatimonadales bacterium]|nr:aminotransferase class V-fold PLP-dependent enzyme [Gemmatimonadales bacterium]